MTSEARCIASQRAGNSPNGSEVRKIGATVKPGPFVRIGGP